MADDKLLQLTLEGREAPRLDFHQQFTAHDVDDGAVDVHLKTVSRLCVPRFERGVQRSFVEQADPIRDR